jgi:hypothetical protein
LEDASAGRLDNEDTSPSLIMMVGIFLRFFSKFTKFYEMKCPLFSSQHFVFGEFGAGRPAEIKLVLGPTNFKLKMARTASAWDGSTHHCDMPSIIRIYPLRISSQPSFPPGI